MNIELKKRSPIKELIHKCACRTEDILFSLVLKLPERMIPKFVMDWLERYVNKRNSRLQQQITRQKWKTMALEQAAEQIHKRQQS